MKRNKFSLGKYFKDTYSTACVIPVIAFLLIAIVFVVLGYVKNVISLQWTIILIVFLSIVSVMILVWFIFKTLKAIIQEEKEKQIMSCKNCSADYTKYLFARHGLISLNDIIEQEKRLKDHPEADKCEVLNYTTLIDTYSSDRSEEDQIENIVKQNREKGVRYKVVYLSKGFATERNKRIYDEENMKYYSEQGAVFNETQFDYLIHKTPEKMYCYVAVNFNSRTEKCSECSYMNPSNPCDFLNDHLIYRILPKNEAEHVYRQIDNIFIDMENA